MSLQDGPDRDRESARPVAHIGTRDRNTIGDHDQPRQGWCLN